MLGTIEKIGKFRIKKEFKIGDEGFFFFKN
jgi:hypothetical protein